MSEPNGVAYAAQITIHVAGDEAPTQVTITLTPSDSIPVEGRTKPLGDCTLADLQAYAGKLEAQVQAVYESITLEALHADEAVEVIVTLGDSAEPLASWSEEPVVLLMDAAQEAAPESEDQPSVEDPVADETSVDEPPVEAEATPDEPTDATDEPEPVAEEESAQEDAISAEIELPAEPTPEPEPEVTLHEPDPEPEPVLARSGARPDVPAIAPSQARVRVAGQQRPIGHPTWAAVDILMDESALRASQAHALSSLNREVAGVLVGPRPEKQPDGRYLVHVIDTIIAKHTVMQGASVTYTPESWRYLNDTLRERYPDETAVMVGWYHTHPGFGIFLSGMDLFIHQNFFTQIWHIAYVLDPRARTSGFFCWNRPKTEVKPYDFAWPDWANRSW